MDSKVVTRMDNRGFKASGPPRRVRTTAITLALLLALGATVAVFLYVNAVKKQQKTPAASDVTVIVSKQNIPANTSLNSLISAGAFTTLQIPRDAVVSGAVTDLSQLRNQTTNALVLQGERITTQRLQYKTNVGGGIFGLKPGYVAETVRLDPQKVPGQLLQPGDHVTIFASFTNLSIVSDASVRAALEGKSTSTSSANIGSFTVDLVPDVTVLKVSGETSSLTSSSNDGIMVTLELLPKDAANVAFSQNNGDLWLALLPPAQKGVVLPPVNIVPILQQGLIGVAK